MSVADKTYQNAGNSQVLAWIEDEDRRILDLGCGAGDNARRLADAGRIIDGVTMSSAEANLAKSTMHQVVVHNLEAGLPDQFRGPYDVVIASHVLEHICFPSLLLAGVRHVLSSRGRLIVALPNLMMVKYRLRLLLGRFDYESGGIMDDTHFRWYTFKSARQMLEAAGFRVIHASADGHLPVGALRRMLPQTWMRALDRMACRTFPGLFGAQMIYVVSAEQK